jgi:biopolymer transport protein ExbB/biopolymer transport protein TolQ
LKKISSRFVFSSAPLLLLAIWAIALGISRTTIYSEARKQSIQVVPALSAVLREGKLDEAIKVAQRYKESHVAKVVLAGVQEFRDGQISADFSSGGIESVSRALKRAESSVHVELEQGVPQLSLIAVIAPAVGLVVTLLLVINTLRAFGGRLMDVNGLAESIGPNLLPLAAGLIVAVLASCLSIHFAAQLRTFDVEMQNASSELITYCARRLSRQP